MTSITDFCPPGHEKIALVGNTQDLRARTKQFALRILRLYQALPAKEEARILGRQILRSGTSVGANYRAACRARSKAGIHLETRYRSGRGRRDDFLARVAPRGWDRRARKAGVPAQRSRRTHLDFRGLALHCQRHRFLRETRSTPLLLLHSDFSLLHSL